ncbi:hypothetical protein [Salmonella enterica]|uniref:hypothetical protein n=1 Tax=Salmonella enterica TaxID=28901 RepID=UPI003917E18F
MKKNRIRALTVIIVTALSVAMAGCSEMDNMSRIVRADADIAQQHMDSQKRHQAPLVWTDKPWVNLKPIVQATPSPQKAGLPACNITVGSRDGLTLPEVSGLITRRCGVRVILSPEVMVAGSGVMSAGVTRRISGTLPVPDDSGRIPLDQLGGTGGGPQASAAPVMLNALHWQGQLGGLLDNITAHELAEKVSKIMNDIADSAQNAKSTMEEMLNCAEEQSCGIEQVRIAVSEMDRVTQQNAALVEESAAATGALMQQTSRLTQVVSLFRTERSTAGA